MLKIEECFYLYVAFLFGSRASLSSSGVSRELVFPSWYVQQILCSPVFHFELCETASWNRMELISIENFYPSVASHPQKRWLFITTSLSKSFCYLDHLL